jgi:hypothetical protein
LNVASHMRSVMSPLKRLVEKYNFALNITRHNRKSDEGSSAIYKGGGSIDGTAAVRSEIATMNVVRDDEDDPSDDSPGLMVYQPTSHFAFVHVKGNLNGKGKGVDYSIRKNKFHIDGLSDKTANVSRLKVCCWHRP